MNFLVPSLTFCLCCLLWPLLSSAQRNAPPASVWNFKCENPESQGNRSWPRDNTPAAAMAQGGPAARMLPIRINYVLTGAMRLEHETILRPIFRRINTFLADIGIKTHPLVLDAMYFNLDEEPTMDTCTVPSWCHSRDDGVSVPAEYLEPCRRGLVKGVNQKPSEFLKLEASKGISLMIYVRVFNPKYGIQNDHCDNEERWAYAAPCVWNTRELYRPIAGMLVVCRDPKLYQPIEHLYAILLHETMHVVTAMDLYGIRTTKHAPGRAYPANDAVRKPGMNGWTWKSHTLHWTNADGSPAQHYTELSITPAVMDVMKEYFRCPRGTVQGAELSNFAHWSMRLFPDDVLSAMVFGPNVVMSKLTLALLNDSGWYEVNMSRAQPSEFDASIRLNEGEYCYLASTQCTMLFEDGKRRLARNSTTLPWVGPYCDPTGEFPTRACSSDGRYRQLCLGGDARTLGCSVYVRNHTLDRWGDDCSKEKLPSQAAPYKVDSMCVSFSKYQPSSHEATESSWLKNFPGCYQMKCTLETKSIDLYLFYEDRQSPCVVSQKCGVNKSVSYTWEYGENCFPPYYGKMVCPDYEKVCEKPGGVGAPKANGPSREEVPSDISTPSAKNQSFGIIAMIMIAKVILKCAWTLQIE